jgi:single stranded DNA-binding protein
MNKFIVTGRLTKDPEVKQMGSTANIIATINVAVQGWKNKQTGKYDADFFYFKAFDKKADFIHQYLKKGDMVSIIARIKNANYEKDGKTIYKDDAVIEEIEILNKTKANDIQEISTDNTNITF